MRAGRLVLKAAQIIAVCDRIVCSGTFISPNVVTSLACMAGQLCVVYGPDNALQMRLAPGIRAVAGGISGAGVRQGLVISLF